MCSDKVEVRGLASYHNVASRIINSFSHLLQGDEDEDGFCYLRTCTVSERVAASINSDYYSNKYRVGYIGDEISLESHLAVGIERYTLLHDIDFAKNSCPD